MPDPVVKGAGGQSAGSQNGAADQGSDLPAWLTKLSPEEQEDAKGHLLRQADYTKKTQEVASLRQLKEKYPDRDLSQDVENLSRWENWRRTDWPTIEQKLARLDELEAASKRAPAESKSDEGRRGYRATPEDFYEQERLDRTLTELENGFTERATGRVKEWYEKEELPRIDRLASNYLNTMVGLLRVAWPKDAPPIADLLREAGASQQGDFLKVAEKLREQGTKLKTAGFDEGYQKGLEEGKKAGGGPPAPPPRGVGAPNWRKPPEAKRPSREDLFQDVLRDVETRRGPLPV